MILVDIEVPVMGKSYDFQVDEDVPVSEVLLGVSELICMKEQCGLSGEPEELSLWDIERQRQLPPGQTSRGCGIMTGTRLLLV